MVRTPSGEWRNLHGRRRGKPLKPAQKAALADLPALALPGVRPDENPGRAPLDLAGLAAGRAVWLEIGFGGGEHLVHQATRHPEVLMLGCEPFVNGVAKLLVALRAAGGPGNVRIHPGDVRELFDVLPPAGLDRVFLLYPDPWPKRRHHDRRFVTAQYLGPLARAMAPGATLRIATDIPDYVRQTDDEVPRAGFDDLRPAPVARARPWDDWQPTRYERKALREGRVPAYLEFRRRP